MKKLRYFLILFGALFIHFESIAVIKLSVGSGNRNTSGIRSPIYVPGAENAVIKPGHISILNANRTWGLFNVIGTLSFGATSDRILTVPTSWGHTGNLRIPGIPDLSTSTFYRSAAGVSLSIRGSSGMRLAGASGGQSGSNFLTNFRTLNIGSNSATAYYRNNQTVYNTSNYTSCK